MIKIEKAFDYQDQSVELITMSNDYLEVKFLSLGATVVSIKLLGDEHNLIVSYENLEDYKHNNDYYLGSTIGPLAGRTAFGSFVMEKQEYKLDLNKPPHHLHGGKNGLSNHVMEYLYEDDERFPSLVFIKEIDHSQEGYPGKVKTIATFKLFKSTLVMNLKAFPSVKMPLNLTNHMYFNLGKADTVMNHLLSISANQVIKLDDQYAPTNEVINVVNSAFDFRTAKTIQSVVAKGHPQFEMTKGLDHAFRLVDKHNAILFDSSSKISLNLSTTANSLVCYTANFFDEGFVSNRGTKAHNHLGIAFEPQNTPNGVNLNFEETKFYTPEEPFDETTYYNFNRLS